MIHPLKIALTALFLLNSPAFADQKLALIIGNSQYDGAMGALQNPVNDAQAIDSQLIRLGFKTTLVKNANKIKMLEAIDDFSNQISRGDTVVFYYAGHGASANGNNYLMPIGAQSPKNDKWFDETLLT
ncbi:MAG: caspase family protein [Moraxellaceae bacterium]|nr:caspase family protein [Moraxellaceae bacterium]